MKLIKSASGKTTIKMSRQEWTDMGKKAGWMKEAQEPQQLQQRYQKEQQQRYFIAQKMSGFIKKYGVYFETEAEGMKILEQGYGPDIKKFADEMNQAPALLFAPNENTEFRTENAAFGAVSHKCSQPLNDQRMLQDCANACMRMVAQCEEALQNFSKGGNMGML